MGLEKNKTMENVTLEHLRVIYLVYCSANKIFQFDRVNLLFDMDTIFLYYDMNCGEKDGDT